MKHVSVILPCRNEEQSIGVCISKIQKIFKKHNINGEIIVSDSSTDKSPMIAKELGATVIKHDQEGYGTACIQGFRHAKGKYIFFADPDGTYDFAEIPKFLKPLKRGYDFVIGNRYGGKIDRGAMPFLHSYIGHPMLSVLLRLILNSKISDAHCGMRAIRKEALDRLRLRARGMEFATEMIIQVHANRLRIKEIPINYHRRSGRSKIRAFRDGFRHLMLMLTHRLKVR